MRSRNEEPKPLVWRGSSKFDFMAFPRTAQREMGYALFLAQIGERHPTMAKTLKGFGGGNVIEVRESYEGDAYRAVYTVCVIARPFTSFTHFRKNLRRARRPRGAK